uniref:EGF-like domain-containing protein n=1 Tax=Romanomermis culicivorax TaxID=13658 RepID=A0A915JYH7_ROMCU
MLPFSRRPPDAAGTTAAHINCSLDDPSTCPALNEVCAKTRNVLGCVCDVGFSRNPATGVCLKMEDECGDETLNDCDPNAICMDNPLSYECLCREGYLDMSAQPHTTPGRHCMPLHDCDSNADCIDLPKGYTCSCKAGFSDVSRNPNKQPGRKCTQEKNECSRKEDNDCSPFATCTDLTNGYRCRCNEGFIDVSPNNRTGTVCRQIVNECLNSSLNDCDPQNSDCTDTLDSYICRCKSQFLDQDPSKPGRKCVQYSSSFLLETGCHRHREKFSIV